MNAKAAGPFAKKAEHLENPKKTGGSWKHDFLMNKWLYVLTIPVVAFFLIFNYLPMAGLLMAFENYKPALGLFKSQWVGWSRATLAGTGWPRPGPPPRGNRCSPR